ncbi:hypothetical protein BFR47_10410 [Oceanisphaera psychrotolerans]|uniref:Uncharacterized protein n=1 Tax=Oceanisphaera psychrotolerans TaxID=1414654 RepID=A0A1J4QJV0_9GAMM|nr:hypothetical protein BFR47_10410 [Oceanisphaera psychrotolerans]
MTLLFARVLTTTELDDLDFFATTVSYDFSNYFATVDVRNTNFNVFTLGNHQHFVEFNRSAGFNVQLFQTYHLPFGYTVLFSAALDYRVHDYNSEYGTFTLFGPCTKTVLQWSRIVRNLIPRDKGATAKKSVCSGLRAKPGRVTLSL